MLYLFNTSSRRVYLDNIFATMYLPYGMENMYQYSYKNAVDISSLSVNKGEEVLIIYIDIFSNRQIAYIPLRKGRLLRTEKRDGRIYYYVQLLDFVYSKDVKCFSTYLEKKFDNKVYHRDGNKLWKGVLSILEKNGDDKINSSICSDQESWINTVKELSKRKLFQNPESLFVKIEITATNGKMINVEDIDKIWGISLVASKTYYLNVTTYINGFFDRNPMEKLHLVITDGSNLCGLNPIQIEIGSKQSFFQKPIKACDVKKLSKSLFSISCKEAEEKELSIKFCNNRGFYIFVSEGYKAYLRGIAIIACAFLLAIMTWINTLPVDSIISDISQEMSNGHIIWYKTWLFNLCMFLDSSKYFINAVTSALITLATLGLIHLYGSPKL